MFDYSGFKSIKKYFGLKGINTDVNKQYLDDNYSVDMENIIPFPIGCGTVRYGSIEEIDLVKINSDYKNIEFQHIHVLEKNKYLCYLTDFKEDPKAVIGFTEGARAFDKILIQTENLDKYLVNSYVNLTYTTQLDVNDPYIVNTVKFKIKDILPFGDDRNIFVLDGFLDPSIINFVLGRPDIKPFVSISYSHGMIALIDSKNQTIDFKKDGLLPYCTPSFCFFMNRVYICNGYDDCLYFDINTEQVLPVLVPKLQDDQEDRLRINNRSISFNSKNANAEDYLNKDVLVKINAIERKVKCLTFTKDAENKVTLTFDQDLPEFNRNASRVAYYTNIPKFNYMTAIDGRIFALGQGISNGEIRSKDVRLKIYFQYRSESLDGWFSDSKYEVPYANLAFTHGEDDNLEAIIEVSNYICFMGRKKIQVWSAGTPKGALVEDRNVQPMRYLMTLEVGLLHKDLVVKLPNQAIFLSKKGLYSLSSFNQARQFAANPIQNINNALTFECEQVYSDFHKWIQTKAFCYVQGNMYGFRIFGNLCYIGFVDKSDVFTKFTGDFDMARTFATSKDTSLTYSIGTSIYSYGDGADGKYSYGDLGGKSAIFFKNIFSRISSNRYFNYYVFCDVDHPSSLDFLTIQVTGENGKIYSKVLKKYALQDLKGDVLNTVSTAIVPPVDVDPTFMLGDDFFKIPKSFRFNFNDFYAEINGSSKYGKIIINKIELYGK